MDHDQDDVLRTSEAVARTELLTALHRLRECLNDFGRQWDSLDSQLRGRHGKTAETARKAFRVIEGGLN